MSIIKNHKTKNMSEQNQNIDIKDLDGLDIILQNERNDEESLKSEFLDLENPFSEEQTEEQITTENTSATKKEKPDSQLQKSDTVDQAQQESQNQQAQNQKEKSEFTQEELEKSVKDDEAAELDRLNSLFKTNYKSISELKESLKKEEVNEEAILIQQKVNEHNLYVQKLRLGNKELIFEDLKEQYQVQGKNISDQNILDEINDRVDSMTQNELEYAVRYIRDSMTNKALRLKSDVDAYISKTKLSDQEKIQKRSESLKSSVNDFYMKEDFYGLKLEKQDFISSYKDVETNKLITLIENDPKIAMELQLLYNNREKLAKLNNSATYSDGIKDTLDALKGKSQKTSEKVVMRQDDQENDWIKKWAG